MLKKVTLLLATSLSLFALHTVELNINQKDLGLGFGLDIGPVSYTHLTLPTMRRV